MPIRFRAVVLDCSDPQKLAEFYRGFLDWEVVSNEPDWVALRSDAGISLSFQQVEQYVPPAWPDPTRPQQVHLDFAVDDEAELESLETTVLQLGGARLEEPPERVGDLRIYADPAGHPFCLIPGV